MVTEVEGTHEIGGVSLYTKTWKPESPPTAILVFIHGFSDHCNRYYELFPTLASRGIEVRSFDQRGWGRSVKKPSDRGLTGPTSQVLFDLAHFIRAQLPSLVPLFVMGHSMGGAEILTLASTAEYSDLTGQVRGWLTESGHLGFPAGAAPSQITVVLGRLAGRFLPNRQLENKIPSIKLSRDPAVRASLDSDKLCHNMGTLEGLAGLLDRCANLGGGKTKLNGNVKSLWISHGSGDLCTSWDHSKKWCEQQTQVEDKEFKSYEGWSHQLHADLPDNRGVFAKDVGDWILARCDGEAKSKL